MAAFLYSEMEKGFMHFKWVDCYHKTLNGLDYFVRIMIIVANKICFFDRMHNFRACMLSGTHVKECMTENCIPRFPQPQSLKQELIM